MQSKGINMHIVLPKNPDSNVIGTFSPVEHTHITHPKNQRARTRARNNSTAHTGICSSMADVERLLSRL
jgi:hypothetical protein